MKTRRVSVAAAITGIAAIIWVVTSPGDFSFEAQLHIGIACVLLALTEVLLELSKWRRL